ncbi:MAG: cysteine synthase family protein, partial [Lachnoclostridium sp.]|nr:cysteine synthase family protein [Lachnoclostridium sp.]
KGEERSLFAKAEYYNLTGSLKDRIAFHMLRMAYEREEIEETDIITEATSGNTGIAFSAMGSYLGHKVVIFMPDWMSSERIRLIESYGAKVRLVTKEEGGFLGSIDMTEKLAERGGYFLPRQFSNEDNVTIHYEVTANEILEQLNRLSLKPDCVVAGVGTGGTIMGLIRRFREVNPDCKGHPLEPANSPTLSTGHKVGQHKIQGISDEFIPSIVKLNELDRIVSVDDNDSIIMSRMLSEKLGIGVGLSSGANFLGCVIASHELPPDSTVVTIFADDNKKYLSTDYSIKQTPGDEYLTSHLELLGVTALSG